jgi:hypothetical protein
VREFFRAHRLGAARVADVVKPRLLRNLSARFEHADLPLDFMFERALQEAERVQVSSLRLSSRISRRRAGAR